MTVGADFCTEIMLSTISSDFMSNNFLQVMELCASAYKIYQALSDIIHV